MPLSERNTYKILKSYAANQPVLKKMGYVIPKPLAVITDLDNIERQKKILMNFSLPILNLAEKIEKITSRKVNADFVSAVYDCRWKEKIRDLAAVTYSDSSQITSPLLIFADGRILDEGCENFLFVFLDKIPEEEILIEEIVPTDERLPVILYKIEEIASLGTTQSERALLAAACFMYSDQNERNGEFEELLSHAKLLAKCGEEDVNGELSKIFIDRIFEWQNDTELCNIFKLPKLDMETIKQIDKGIFYNDEYFYMSDSIFRLIAQPLLKTYPEPLLKIVLAKEEILRPENGKTNTVKMNFRSIAGTYERVRMLRFQRAAFCQCGGIDIIERCLDKKLATEEMR